MEKSSTINSFSSNFCEWLHTDLYPRLISGLQKEKGVTITVEDIDKYFDLPVNSAPIPASTSFNAAMGLPSNSTIVNTQAAPKANKGGRKKATAADANGITCAYKFVKGVKEGTNCDKAPVAYGYCVNCIGKNEALEELGKRPMPISKNIINKIRELKDKKRELREYLSNSNNITGDAAVSSSVNTTTGNALVPPNFVELPGTPYLFTCSEPFPIKGILFIKKKPEDPFVCRGKMVDNEKGEKTGPFPLTPEEAGLLAKYGYTYVPPASQNNTQSSSTQQVQSTPTVQPPQIPPMVHSPQVPNMTQSPQVPNMTQSPQVPNMMQSPQVPNMTQFPQVPNMMQSPQVPTMVQLPPSVNIPSFMVPQAINAITNAVPAILRSAGENSHMMPNPSGGPGNMPNPVAFSPM
jgi:hypothetical protein